MAATIAPVVAPVVISNEDIRNYDYSACDELALNVPESETQKVRDLARALSPGMNNELLKTRAIFRWIAANISYDTEQFFAMISLKPKLSFAMPPTADEILRRRSGVCDGYATLFVEIAKQMGLNVKKISGNAKGFGYHPGEELSSVPNHAWVRVSITGTWRLVDATWGAGHLNAQNVFERLFNEFYFCTPPEQLIYSHFPENSSDQLLPRPVDKTTFCNLPKVWSPFFSNNMQFISHPNAAIIQCGPDGTVVIDISVPKNIGMLVKLLQDGNEVTRRKPRVARSSDTTVRVSVTLPASGCYDVQLFVCKSTDGCSMMFEIVCMYEVRGECLQAVDSVEIDSEQCNVLLPDAFSRTVTVTRRVSQQFVQAPEQATIETSPVPAQVKGAYDNLLAAMQ